MHWVWKDLESDHRMTDLNFTGIVGLELQERINSEFILSRSS